MYLLNKVKRALALSVDLLLLVSFTCEGACEIEYSEDSN
jgi:hypothetical protein